MQIIVLKKYSGMKFFGLFKSSIPLASIILTKRTGSIFYDCIFSIKNIKKLEDFDEIVVLMKGIASARGQGYLMTFDVNSNEKSIHIVSSIQGIIDVIYCLREFSDEHSLDQAINVVVQINEKHIGNDVDALPNDATRIRHMMNNPQELRAYLQYKPNFFLNLSDDQISQFCLLNKECCAAIIEFLTSKAPHKMKLVEKLTGFHYQLQIAPLCTPKIQEKHICDDLDALPNDATRIRHMMNNPQALRAYLQYKPNFFLNLSDDQISQFCLLNKECCAAIIEFLTSKAPHKIELLEKLNGFYYQLQIAPLCTLRK